jgi:hypothetical protein
MSFVNLKKLSDEIGLKSRHDNNVRIQQLHYIIKNRFYCGEMIVKGQTYKHNYTPLVSKSLFDKCQKIRDERGYKRSDFDRKSKFLFEGMFKCKTTDRQITCDIKKGRYIYLISYDTVNLSKKIWVSEKNVIKKIDDAFEAIHITDEYYNEIVKYIRKTCANDQRQYFDHKRSLEKKLHDTQTKTDRLTELLINDQIKQDTYQRQSLLLQSEHDDISVKLSSSSSTIKDIEKSLLTLVKILNMLISLNKSSRIALKRILLKTVFSNLYLNASNVEYTYVSVLSRCVEMCRNLKWQWCQTNANYSLKVCCVKFNRYRYYSKTQLSSGVIF